ncbi:MAG: DNA repair protein RadC [Prevotella sp.]|nr:DNA repair protein RadC [Prevotella sp.]
MSDNLSIWQWSEDERPRERLRDLGPQALTNAELLAILIGSGRPGISAVDLMKKVLTDCQDNLNTLGKMSINQLTQYDGIGPAKAITILAACELGKRRAMDKVKEDPIIDSSAKVYEYMHNVMKDFDHEEAWVMLLKQNFKLIKAERLSYGGLSETMVDIRLLMRTAILNNATVIAFCHNHPSGSIRPSRADDLLTTNIKKACEVMHIHLLDHVIVTDGQYYSYRDMGKL